MDFLPFQVLILEGICIPDIFQIPDDDMLANAEFPVPACAYLRRNILKIIFFRLHPIGYPFICIIIAAGFVLFKNICPVSVHRFSEMLQQHAQRLVRGFLKQSDPKGFIDDCLQILNAPHATTLLTASIGRAVLSGSFKKIS